MVLRISSRTCLNRAISCCMFSMFTAARAAGELLCSWVKAIQDDGLPWKHVSDLGFWNNAAAQEYGVSSIPYTVLVDRDGKILQKGLRAQQLESVLSELFDK